MKKFEEKCDTCGGELRFSERLLCKSCYTDAVGEFYPLHNVTESDIASAKLITTKKRK